MRPAGCPGIGNRNWPHACHARTTGEQLAMLELCTARTARTQTRLPAVNALGQQPVNECRRQAAQRAQRQPADHIMLLARQHLLL